MSEHPIIVTGAAGFIGAAVADTLMERGTPVIGIDSMNDYYAVSLKEARRDRLQARHGNLFTFLALDFANMDSLASALEPHSFDRIVHLGAQAGVRYSLENPQAYVASNLAGHVNMLEIARARKVAHMVYAQFQLRLRRQREASFRGRGPGRPSRFALRGHQEGRRTDERDLCASVPHPADRAALFTVYGPWGRPDMALWKFTERMLSGRPIEVYNNGEMYRDFTYIDDIVAGVLACLDRPPADDGLAKAGGSIKPHALYNIGNNRSEHLMRLIEVLEEACGVKAVLDMQPMQPGDVHATYADITALAQDSGYAPLTPIEVGVPCFVDWYREYTGK